MRSKEIQQYEPVHHIRIVTATSLFDGHDVSINIMRRILQNSGAEVIHLGHNRSAAEIVDCAIQEDVQAIAITSYQGGHVEYFKYIYDLLESRGSNHIKIFGGGGGTILPAEIESLYAHGITRIYTPDDGREMGLQGMINDLLSSCDFSTKLPGLEGKLHRIREKEHRIIGNLISVAENDPALFMELYARHLDGHRTAPVIGITGPGGAGKSVLVDELIRRFLSDLKDKTFAIISVDPSKQKTGGALLGDRIRMNSINNPRVFMRSMATRQNNSSLNKQIKSAIRICQASGFDFVFVETSGIGQSGNEIIDYSDVSLYVMTPEYGSPSQLEKIDMLDHADLIAVNKFDKFGSLDALRDVREQFRRNRNISWENARNLPVYGTMASFYNDHGIDTLYVALLKKIEEKSQLTICSDFTINQSKQSHDLILPATRYRYLSEIVETCRENDKYIEEQASIALKMFQLQGAMEMLKETPVGVSAAEYNNGDPSELEQVYVNLQSQLDNRCKKILDGWDEFQERYTADVLDYTVRGKSFSNPLYFTTLSNLQIPRVCIPKYKKWDDRIRWALTENVPGEYPYTAGVFPLKRKEEVLSRMTAGEGGPERSNKRYHYLCKGQKGLRISTAHDSVTLYGEDPDIRPDIFGKIGNTGVSICNIDDSKKLYSGFDLLDPNSSVNLTINGPAPMILGFFLNAVIDQQCELYIRQQGMTDEVQEKIRNIYAQKDIPMPHYNGALPDTNDGLGLLLLGVSGDEVIDRNIYERIKAHSLQTIRGTVQSDILKEDQAQNTCIFSAAFALKMMGDVQEYFVANKVRNFYSISVSGYHIAEAGANPVTQLAFTLANAFTYIEYFLSRGIAIDDFAPNMSFFFSNGMDPEYAVLGRVARRIWARTIKLKYKGNSRSQKLKYHIQTSGRSLHAQEIGFNDIRTTLEALYALTDNCNSLHTNAYDEAITLPTEDSVRQALAIQHVIIKEFGLAKNENSLQGSFIIDELTDMVEKAVLRELENISSRGGVMGAMERVYQRTKIQEESMHYETLKHNGDFPIVGVNTFLKGGALSPTIIPGEVTRSTQEEKEFAIYSRDLFLRRNGLASEKALLDLKGAALKNENFFNHMMQACKVCSLGQISRCLYEIGGQYRRNS